eukprot:624198-Prorocentrum_minimum.AAC.1
MDTHNLLSIGGALPTGEEGDNRGGGDSLFGRTGFLRNGWTALGEPAWGGGATGGGGDPLGLPPSGLGLGVGRPGPGSPRNGPFKLFGSRGGSRGGSAPGSPRKKGSNPNASEDGSGRLANKGPPTPLANLQNFLQHASGEVERMKAGLLAGGPDPGEKGLPGGKKERRQTGAAADPSSVSASGDDPL